MSQSRNCTHPHAAYVMKDAITASLASLALAKRKQRIHQKHWTNQNSLSESEINAHNLATIVTAIRYTYLYAVSTKFLSQTGKHQSWRSDVLYHSGVWLKKRGYEGSGVYLCPRGGWGSANVTVGWGISIYLRFHFSWLIKILTNFLAFCGCFATIFYCIRCYNLLGALEV